MRFTSITRRFMFWFTMIALLPILLVSYSLLYTFEQELRQTVARQMSSIADKKADQIDAYLNALSRDLQIQSQGDTLHRAVSKLTQALASGGATSAAYRQLDASYRDYFKHYINSNGYYDAFLISPQGTVVYSYLHEADFATNLFSGPYRNSGLGKVVHNALSTLESGISEFEFYAPSGDAIYAFVAVPIMHQGKLAGVLAMQIDNRRVFQVLLDRTGLGDSGETMVARLEEDGSALAMAPLKAEPDAALKRKISLNDELRATALKQALNAERGGGFAIDYKGQPVIAAWRYLPRMRWGMVVKMDTAEVLAPLYRVRNFGVAVIAVAVLAALTGAFLLGRRVVLPLQTLSARAQDIAAGNLGQRVPVEGRDELGQLATSFNTMAERLQSYQTNLEEQVRQRTAELYVAKEEAEQANKSKSVFLASMSHELRTPLNAILGYAQLMQMDTSLPAGVRENATEIRSSGDFVLTLMNDILDLSRIESGKLQLEIETVPLSDTMKTCQAHNIHAAKLRNVTLHLAASCAAYTVTADKRALTQVLNNLVSNAIKYNRADGRVNVSCTDVAHGKVRISVMDTGIGIAPDKQSQVFQSFNRLGAEMSNIEGTGIGLAISRKLIEAMGGEIGMDSVQGLGSTFWIELQAVKKSDSAISASVASSQEASSPGKVLRVLVAEDYAPNQHVLLLQLQTMGCEAEIAPDGAAALNMWRNKPYDLILTDINMPVMNGEEFARAVRAEEIAKGGRIPIIAITATTASSELKRYQLAGIDEVLGKPLSIDVLRAGMTRWLGDITARSPVSDAVITADRGTGDAIFDLTYLYHILGEVNLDQARMLLDTFIQTAEEGLRILASQTPSAALVAKEMHKQKSSARTVGALRYAGIAALLEQQTKDRYFTGIEASLATLSLALGEVQAASAKLLASPRIQTAEPIMAPYPAVVCHSALVVDDDMVVLQQVKAMLNKLGVNEVLTAVNGVEATRALNERGGEIEVLVCDLSMPEMDGVELIRGFGKTNFKGGLILISGADEKIISTVNKLAVLQGVRVLGQLQKPVSAAQLAILLSHADDLPVQKFQAASGPLATKEEIRAAMVAKEFSIWFQPKVDATSLRAVGIEALARWQLPSGKFIPPDNFITVAEREGLIGELSQILVSIALTEGAKLFAAGFPLKIAINLSGRWLNDLSLPDFIFSNTRSAGLRAVDVILEVTETGVMEDLTIALDVLSRLRLKGFGLSIDDFGIGYSSFEQLGRIPFTEMKLDRSFVNKGVQDAAARAILESSMDMARKLNLSTVAEGVETELDLKLVRSLSCDLVQGYLIAKPMPVQDLIVWLDNAKNKNRRH